MTANLHRIQVCMHDDHRKYKTSKRNKLMHRKNMKWSETKMHRGEIFVTIFGHSVSFRLYKMLGKLSLMVIAFFCVCLPFKMTIMDFKSKYSGGATGWSCLVFNVNTLATLRRQSNVLYPNCRNLYRNFN